MSVNFLAIAMWAIREIGALALREIAARRGRFEYIVGDRYFVQTIDAADGSKLPTVYYPDPKDLELGFHRLRFSGSFVNETGKPIMLRDLQVAFVGPDGPRIVHTNPNILVNGKSGPVYSVPAHDHANVLVATGIDASILTTTYSGAIAVLEGSTTDGRRLCFAICHGAVWGSEIVAWDSRRHKVVTPGTRAWIRAHRQR